MLKRNIWMYARCIHVPEREPWDPLLSFCAEDKSSTCIHRDRLLPMHILHRFCNVLSSAPFLLEINVGLLWRCRVECTRLRLCYTADMLTCEKEGFLFSIGIRTYLPAEWPMSNFCETQSSFWLKSYEKQSNRNFTFFFGSKTKILKFH